MSMWGNKGQERGPQRTRRGRLKREEILTMIEDEGEEEEGGSHEK